MANTELIRRIAETTDLDDTEAARIIDDVLAWYRRPTEEYVRTRHVELQRAGLRNPAIFTQIAGELADRVVAAPPLTDRQIRRIIYG